MNDRIDREVGTMLRRMGFSVFRHFYNRTPLKLDIHETIFLLKSQRSVRLYFQSEILTHEPGYDVNRETKKP